MNFNLENKKILITGATGGIGNALSKKFIDYKCKIIFTSSSKDKLNILKNKFGKDHLYYFLDLSNLDELDINIKKIVDENKDIEILINNAGITKDNLLMRMSDDQWDDVLNINLKGSFTCIRSVIKHMMKKKFGRIINITSIVGITGNAGQANYAASKSGLIGLTKSIAKEVASRGITANCVAPGWIETSMTDQLSTEVKNKFLSQIPTGKIGQSKDIANTVIFLASDEAEYITGQTITVDGGRIIN